MRNFIIAGHRASTTPEFSLSDLAGSGGRMDILARAINAAFFLSHDIRRDVEVALILLGPEDPPKNIRLLGNELKYLNPNERSTGGLIRNAIVKHSAIKNRTKLNKDKSDPNSLSGELNTSPGIHISATGFSDVLKFYFNKSTLIYLHEDSPYIIDSELSGDLTFIFSDDLDFTKAEEEDIKKYSTHKFSLGPKIYHTDHCVSVVHNILDRRKLD